MRKWIPMLILASAQFVMVLDSSVMNVAISQIVDDLDTSIQGVQTAITLYTLVMAAFVLLGAKLGDILGRNRAFVIGLAIYGVGSLSTALSPNLTVLLLGWSGVEGFGAVLVVPAIAALTAANYEGKDRALAYALLGGIAAIAVAAGPLIGGGGAGRLRDLAKQRLGLRPAAVVAEHQRHGDHALGLLGGAVHGPRRSRPV